jgi:hypothetical protein
MEGHVVDRVLVKVGVREVEQQWAEAYSAVVPAPAGYEAISADRQSDPVRLFKSPIIAFRVYEGTRVDPITVDSGDADRFEAIQYPDGRVFARRGGGVYQDLEHWASASVRGPRRADIGSR